MARVFLTGATGYMGRSLARELLTRGHEVRALARAGSESHLPAGCLPVIGDALRAATFESSVKGCDTLVHLVGVSHPSPGKAAQFRSIDLVSAKESVAAARAAQVRHFIFVSVAHPAPVMREYIAARSEAEDAIRAAGLIATMVRPWYVLGPGHYWPYLLLPVYWLASVVPATRAGAARLGLVTLRQMVTALVDAVENPPAATRIIEVPEIRRAANAKLVR